MKEKRGNKDREREEESGQRGSRNVLFINVRRQAAVFTTTATANAAAAAAATTRGDRGRGGVIFMKTRRLVSCELLHLSSYIGE